MEGGWRFEVPKGKFWRGRRGKMKKRNAAGSEARGERALTARDVEILRWIGRVRFATSEQVAARFEMYSKVAYKRLAVLSGNGLIKRVPVLHNQPGPLCQHRVRPVLLCN